MMGKPRSWHERQTTFIQRLMEGKKPKKKRNIVVDERIILK